MKKALKRIFIVLGALILICAIGFVVWAETPLQSGAEARAALRTDNAIQVVDHGKFISFAPKKQKPNTAFVFYPGGRVDYRAYAPVLRRIAEQGYLVVLLHPRLNLAFFDINAGEAAMEDYPKIKTWVVGGHSLGGVAAAYFADNQPGIKGLVFLASYPADDRLRSSDIDVLSIYGTEDGGLDNGAKIEENKPLQPADTQFIVIKGGNHAQFGDYGPQPGDNPATISPKSQWQQTADAIVRFLAAIES